MVSVLCDICGLWAISARSTVVDININNSCDNELCCGVCVVIYVGLGCTYVTGWAVSAQRTVDVNNSVSHGLVLCCVAARTGSLAACVTSVERS